MAYRQLSLTPHEVIKARRLYRKGMTLKQVAKHIGSTSYTVVWKAICGEPPYDNPLYDDYIAAKDNPGREKFSEDYLVDALWDLMENNLTVTETAEKYGIDQSYLSSVCKKKYRPEVMERVNRLLNDDSEEN